MNRPKFRLQTALISGVFLLVSAAGAVAEEPLGRPIANDAVATEPLDALIAAARSGDVAKIKTLVAASPTLINQKIRSGDTPLFAAVESMQLDAAKILLGAGASIEGTYRRDWLLLHAVAFVGDAGEIKPELRNAMATLLIVPAVMKSLAAFFAVFGVRGGASGRGLSCHGRVASNG